MADTLFKGCWERIRRADAHRDSFADTWANFAKKEDVYDPVLEMHDDGTGVIWVEQLAPMPSVLALQIGEILYQLRATLDGAIYTAAILETGQNPPPDQAKLEFPICATKEEFENAARKFRPLSNTRRDIIKCVQPYRAPPFADEFTYNAILGILNDWARIDRHRQLHFARSWWSNASPKISNLPPGVTIKRITPREGGFLEYENEVARFELDGWVRGMKMQADPQILIDIAIDEPPPPRDAEDCLGKRLEWMIDAVSSVVKMLEASFRVSK